ncbi:hypothetical protein [Serratia fonticola]
MDISRTTFNMARKRGLELTVETGVQDDATLLCFHEQSNECEWMFSYRLGFDGLTWNGNVYLPQDVKEELPAFIADEQALRKVIKFVADNRPFEAESE